MSTSDNMNGTDIDDGDVNQSDGPTTIIRLYLRCSNLPKKAIINQQPDTIARVSLLSSPQQSSNQTVLPPPVPPPSTNNVGEDDDTYSLIDETEVVQRSSNPRYTTTFTTTYEYGSSLLFFIDIFELRTNITTTSKKMKLLGRAVFDVQDVLGSRNNVKARRLRKGGVVYAHIEIEQQQQQTPPSPTRSLSSSITSSTRGDIVSDSQMLVLRLQADSLIHTHSNLSKVISTKHITKPDTYIEISRPSFGGTWIVIYRSPPIKESVSPLYDESIIDLSSFATTVSSSPNDIKVATTVKDDVLIMSSPILITVYKVKRKKCKEIGSFETTIQSLIEHSTHNDGYIQELEYNGMSESGEEVVASDQKKTFHLRPTGKRGENQSYEITGSVTVVTAKIQNSNDLHSNRYSQRFLNVDENDIETTNGDATSICEMTDGDTESSRSISSFIALPPPAQTRPKFNEYVKSGMVDVDLCVAIDFTSSNGDPRIPGTQHFSRDGLMNDYEESIVAIGETISKYSSSQDYPVWGFGAKFLGETRHIFQCGASSTAHGVDGILDAYRTVWETDLIMSGPTVLHSVLRAAASRAKKFYNSSVSKMNNKYCILLILTDGIVQDLKSTQELVRSYSNLRLPLSVIVIGIGRADFSDFKQWSNSPSLEICGRFTFVEFREYQFDPEELSRQALVKVPQDIVDYYLSRNILPN